jgi:hypothetical protein
MPEWNCFWSAALYNTTVSPPQPHPQSLRIHEKMLAAAAATPFRAPMTDFFDSMTAFYGGKYRARPTQGGVFAPLALRDLAALPAMPHEGPMAAAFEAGRARERAQGDDCAPRR